MKTVCAAIASVAALFYSPPAFGAVASDLSGNRYHAFILCSDAVGQYCDQGRIETDTFVFDGADFFIDSVGSSGDYSSGGLTFKARCTGIDGLDEYTFDLQGISLADQILLGAMDIEYRENLGVFGDSVQGTALFLALRQ